MHLLPGTTSLYSRLLRHVRPYRWEFFGAVGAMVVTAATEPFLPALLKPMLDKSFVHKDPHWMHWVPLMLMGLFFVRGIANFIAKFAMNWVGNKVVMDLRQQMFGRLLHLPARYFDDHSTGELISKLVYDANQVMQASTTVLTNLVTDSFVVVGLMGWLIYLNWQLTSVTLLVAPPIAWVVRKVNLRLRHINRDTMSAMGNLTSVLDESIQCQKVIKVFGGIPVETDRFHETSNWVRRLSMKQAAASAANVPIVQFFAALAIALIIGMATWQAGTDQTTVGGFVSFITAMIMLLAPVKRLSDLSESLQRGLAAAESVFALIDQPPETDEGTQVLEHAQGHLHFDQVCFAYPRGHRLALDSFSLKIQAGQTVALVGASGSGKSTLASLVPRFHNPTSGRILLDGYPIANLTLASVRSNLALVTQEVVLFNDTVAHNIGYGPLRGTSLERLREVARAAHALEFIEQLPDGFQTLLGENGARLSGGQRQRIAIARALLKNAPVLILDEATSALDSESERAVQAALDTLMEQRTTLVIAHRLSTIEKADLIVVLDQGHIVEQGTHRELMDREGHYAKLQRLQVLDQ
ncbi:lipid A export permease/ATP-binding protein MsbA [Ferrovum myxofaciens]|jgi:subfamily B ATP-binding cassette protein MsbA|uniref:Lipid A export permease/ATP-binding protein MsbA n=3 Tax=root TaxID=1 RepID=A0A9E6SXB9_9PROT|nr:lipid A export permease/ATP-binding protein MsbA [Ferrovum myxofaciens]MBW8028586.1 lipid A export permease/ATP-binding protein MsbA [Ferrovum sp.]MBU6994982.1 lipid A export permease/ATP-binding protein MsbA [Ferrovum myxofaciens]NDU88460.1 lipid A export permease/ATP-binding protein MsbA [Ferrovum sp.]QKE38785.1 MAG: lipid A export permease/ATP-binding protein MsbA [Ferrovum myxofaciens]QWY73993.1 MAG: lipid A export permease/ATP-binding protein MsbA [Ferrovum myxofaciens]